MAGGAECVGGGEEGEGEEDGVGGVIGLVVVVVVADGVNIASGSCGTAGLGEADFTGAGFD